MLFRELVVMGVFAITTFLIFQDCIVVRNDRAPMIDLQLLFFFLVQLLCLKRESAIQVSGRELGVLWSLLKQNFFGFMLDTKMAAPHNNFALACLGQKL